MNETKLDTNRISPSANGAIDRRIERLPGKKENAWNKIATS
jgi:hypothetical protein